MVLLAPGGLVPEVKPRFRWSVYILYATRFVLGRLAFSYLRPCGFAHGSHAIFSFAPSRAHEPHPHLPDVVHGQHPPPVVGAPAGGSGGTEPVPDNRVVMQPSPDYTN